MESARRLRSTCKALCNLVTHHSPECVAIPKGEPVHFCLSNTCGWWRTEWHQQRHDSDLLHRPVVSSRETPLANLCDQIAGEIMKSNDERETEETKEKTFVEHHFSIAKHLPREFTQLNSIFVLNLPATCCAICCLAALKWGHLGRSRCPGVRRCRRVYRQSSEPLRCPHPRRPTRLSSPKLVRHSL